MAQLSERLVQSIFKFVQLIFFLGAQEQVDVQKRHEIFVEFGLISLRDFRFLERSRMSLAMRLVVDPQTAATVAHCCIDYQCFLLHFMAFVLGRLVACLADDHGG